MNVVEVEDLSLSFNGHPAVNGLNFSVSEGEIFGLVGPDGAGKTTVLRLLAGLLAPDNGRISILGHDVVADPEIAKPDIGYMSQRFGLYDDLSVVENIEFYADLYEVPRGEYKARMDRLLEFSGLAPFMDRLFRNLSGGMKQKVGLTCALIHTPRLLLLDEPTNGVDPVSRRDFWKILYELERDGVTIIVATTYMDEADRCHRLALLDDGRARLVTDPVSMRGMIPGSLYSLKVSSKRKALAILKKIPEAISPNIYGPLLHLSLLDEAHSGRVISALENAAVDVIDFSPIPTTLEDAYLSLLEQEKSGDIQ